MKPTESDDQDIFASLLPEGQEQQQQQQQQRLSSVVTAFESHLHSPRSSDQPPKHSIKLPGISGHIFTVFLVIYSFHSHHSHDHYLLITSNFRPNICSAGLRSLAVLDLGQPKVP
jgi:hypothetical protein